jgi:ABC-type multidrug transport system fused ATPase/permease subunit
VVRLSGGERQRVAWPAPWSAGRRAILDEATSSLDSEMSAVYGRIEHLHGHLTILVITSPDDGHRTDSIHVRPAA